MSQTITITTTTSDTLRGKPIKPDANGFYDVVLCTLDAFNAQGEYYPFTSKIEELLSTSSNLVKKAKNGQLYGELEHPDLTGNLTDMQKVKLFTTINPNRVCALITDITFKKSKSINPQTGRPFVVVRGKVKPMEPYGNILRNNLETPEANTAWSLRGKYIRSFKGKTLVKSLIEFYTWDFVLAQGMPLSDKLGSVTLESLDHLVIDSSNVEAITKSIDDGMSDTHTSESDKTVLHDFKESIQMCSGVDCMLKAWGK